MSILKLLESESKYDLYEYFAIQINNKFLSENAESIVSHIGDAHLFETYGDASDIINKAPFFEGDTIYSIKKIWQAKEINK